MLKSENLKKMYNDLHTTYSRMKIKNHSRKEVKKYIKKSELTNEQIKEIKDFYKPYKKITTDFHNFYNNATGKFYKEYLPDDLYYCDIDMYFNKWNDAAVLDNKCFYGRIFPNIKQPETLAYRINNLWYNNQSQIIKLNEVINILNSHNNASFTITNSYNINIDKSMNRKNVINQLSLLFTNIISYYK